MRPDVLAMLIPIIAIVFGIGIGGMAIWLDYRRKRELYELHHKERMAAIEKGMDLPPLPQELLHGQRLRRSPADYLHRGLVLLLLGIAIFVGLYMSPGAGPHAAFWGLVPAAIGLANLMFYFLAGRKSPSNDSN